MVTKAALMKQAIDHANNTQSPTTADLRLRQKGMDSFALRCFNSLSQDREVSGVRFTTTTPLLYYQLQFHPYQSLVAEAICSCRHPTLLHKPLHHQTLPQKNLARTTPALFEYCMLVRTRKLQDATAQDISFDSSHPRYLTHMQHLALSPSQTATVTLQGQLSQFQTAEDSLRGGHPATNAILNDMAEILLGLFVPWEQLAELVQPSLLTAENERRTYHSVWSTVEPTLSPYIRTFANNIELLRKSKEDCQADAMLQKQSACHATAMDINLDDQQNLPPDSDDETCPLDPSIDETFNTETLLTAFSSIRKTWDREQHDVQRRITSLRANSLPPLSFDFECLRPLDISSNVLYEASGPRFLPPTTLQGWQMCLKDLNSLADQEASPDEPANTLSHLHDFNIDIADGTLSTSANRSRKTP